MCSYIAASPARADRRGRSRSDRSREGASTTAISGPWARGGRARTSRRRRPPSFDQRAAGEPQEDVLERAPAHEHRLRHEPPMVGRGGRRLAVVRVDEDPVGQALDALAEALELPVERLL